MRATFGYFAAFITLGMTSAVLGPTLDRLATNTGTELDQISFLFTAGSIGYFLGTVFGGRLYDRLRGHRIMAAGLLLMAIATATVPQIPLLWVLALTFFTLSIGQGVVDVGGNALIGWVHGQGVGPYMNGLHFFFGLGSFIAPVIIGVLLSLTGGINWVYWVIALAILPVALLIFQTPSPASPADQNEEEDTQTEWRLVGLVMFFLALYVGVEVSFGGWIFTYALSLELSTESLAAYLTSAFWGAFTVGRLLSIPIGARLRPRTILLTDLGIAIGALLLILAFPRSQPALWIGAIGFGLAVASVFPTMITFAGKRMFVSGRVMGYFFMGATIGGTILPWTIGQFFESVGPQFLILTLAGVTTVSVLVVIAILKFPEKNT